MELISDNPHGCRSPNSWAMFHCFPGLMNKDQDQKWSSLKPVSMWDAGVTGSDFTHSTTIPVNSISQSLK